MVIVEEETNFPSVLGPKNIPPTQTRAGPIGSQAMALIGGVKPVHLAQKVRAQLPPRGIGLITGTARTGLARGLGRRLTEAGRARRHEEIYGPSSSLSVESEFETEVHNVNAQMTKYPLVPVLDRPHPVLDAIKAWAPVVPRTKLIGAFGIVDPAELVEERNIPTPYVRPGVWAPGKIIGQLPSVIGFGPSASGPSGPSRTVHPSISIEL